jgi:hypothetical protein
MPQLIVQKRVSLGPQHLRPGRTTHTLIDGNGTNAFPPFVSLESAAYPGEQTCSLFHTCENGLGTDTWHQSVEETMEQAEFEFGVQGSEWTEVNYPYGSE